MKGIKMVTTHGMSREEWLERRKKTIGGSDAAGILGISKYSSPFAVWADKTGKLPDKEDSEAMRQGRDLEDYVAHRFSEATGKKVKRLQAFLYNPLYPFAHANVDRMVVGEDAGLECKTTSTLDLSQFANGVEFPAQYYAQCVHYLAVTGCQKWYLAVLVFGRGFYTYTLERDQAEIDALMEVEGSFWGNYVAAGKPPMPDGESVTSEAIGTIYQESKECSTVQIFGREKLLDEYMDLKSQQEAISGRMDEICNILKLDMGDAENAEGEGYKISWRSQERKTFSVNEFEAAHPDIDLTPYYKISKSRPFRLTKIKEDK